MLRDIDAYVAPAGTIMMSANGEELMETRIHANDDFDDVFGSAPASPTSTTDMMPSFEASPYRSSRSAAGRRGGNLEVSDVPRLREKHHTEGYRDGVTAGKATSVQAGFDEGYGLGAVLGLRIGSLIGMLEALWSAVSIAVPEDSVDEREEAEKWLREKDRLHAMLVEARKELQTQNVFSREWWGENGIWTFDVPEEKEGVDVVFTDVTAAHPLVIKWEKLVANEVEIWGLDLELLMWREDHDGETREGIEQKEDSSNKLESGITKGELSW